MAKKRPRLTGEALDDFFTPTERERTPPPYDRKYTRRTYRVTEEIHQDLKSIAEQEGVGEASVKYLNRLSDALFVMARYQNRQAGVDDVLWDSRT